MDDRVCVIPCDHYEPSAVDQAMEALLAPFGALDWVTPGMRVAIKVNLVGAYLPETAVTTHPEVVCALVKRLIARGASVTVGDSPGGLYNAASLRHIYEVTGMTKVLSLGATLNMDFSLDEVEFPQGTTARHFTMARFLTQADAIINVCKLKTHGMMGMSAGVKNLFGAIAGTNKLEYHFRYPQKEQFAAMLLDINAFLKPRLTLCDAIVGMEGNGPTHGVPKQTGLLLAGENPHTLDLCLSHVMGLDWTQIPTLALAAERGLTPRSVHELTLCGQPETLQSRSYTPVTGRRNLQFQGHGPVGRTVGFFARRFFQAAPRPVRSACTGCGHCAAICPAKAIHIQGKLARIDRKKCICCFCCQEFCPKGAMKARRTAAASLLGRL